MPSRNTQRNFIPGHYYHIYNRGAHKFIVFKDHHDYATFLSLLKKYTNPSTPTDGYKNEQIIRKPNKISLCIQIEINAFCLMPNHFHLLVRLKEKQGITKLMKGVSSSYTTYFNTKYHHSGTLYESKYKMRLIESAEDLVNIMKYIHDNPKEITKSYKSYEWSSYQDYLGRRQLTWLSKIGSDLI